MRGNLNKALRPISPLNCDGSPETFLAFLAMFAHKVATAAYRTLRAASRTERIYDLQRLEDYRSRTTHLRISR